MFVYCKILRCVFCKPITIKTFEIVHNNICEVPSFFRINDWDTRKIYLKFLAQKSNPRRYKPNYILSDDFHNGHKWVEILFLWIAVPQSGPFQTKNYQLNFATSDKICWICSCLSLSDSSKALSSWWIKPNLGSLEPLFGVSFFIQVKIKTKDGSYEPCPKPHLSVKIPPTVSSVINLRSTFSLPGSSFIGWTL